MRNEDRRLKYVQNLGGSERRATRLAGSDRLVVTMRGSVVVKVKQVQVQIQLRSYIGQFNADRQPRVQSSGYELQKQKVAKRQDNGARVDGKSQCRIKVDHTTSDPALRLHQSDDVVFRRSDARRAS